MRRQRVKVSYKRPWLYPKQKDAVFNEARISYVPGSVQSGKSMACVIWLFEQAWAGEDGDVFWWVSRNSEVAGLAFDEMLNLIPDDVQNDIITKKIEADGKEKIFFLNGTVIKFKSAASPDSLYGDTVSAAVVDEASRVDEEAWNAVTTRMSATGGPLRVAGNVTGRNNWFWKACQYAKEGDDWTCDMCGRSFREGMHHTRITVIDSLKAGITDPDYVKQEMATMDDKSFMQSYLSIAPDDGGNPFGIENIRDIIYRDDQGRPTRQLPDGKPACWGWDIAKDQNYTVGIALDYEGNVVEFERWSNDSMPTQLRRMTKLVGRDPALIDATGGSHGDQLLDWLHEEGGRNWEGYKFSGKSKQQIMEGLALAIQDKDIRIPDGKIREELEAFEYEEKPTYTVYSAPRNMNDDAVDSLAMAVHKWRDVQRTPPDVGPISQTRRSSPWSM